MDRVRTSGGLPASSVFMAGGSNGAMMAHVFAMARPGLVAANAPAEIQRRDIEFAAVAWAYFAGRWR